MSGANSLPTENEILGPSRVLIISNGSKWGGEDPDPIGALLGRLETHTLDPSFEEYGNFASVAHGAIHHRGYDDNGEWTERWEDTGPIYADAPYAVNFFGNFFDLSGGFNIVTDDPEIVETLLAAIRTNQATPAYQRAKTTRRGDWMPDAAPKKPGKARRKAPPKQLEIEV